MDNYFLHQELVKRFKLLATRELPGLRIFDRTVGLFYKKRVNGGVVDYSPITINRPGMADAYGLYKTNIGLINLEFEFKSSDKAKQTKEQINWQEFIESMNGKYFIIRDERQGVDDIKKYLSSKGLL